MQRLVINLRLCLFFKLRIAVNGDLNTAITSPRLAESQRADGCTTLRKRTGPRLQSPRWGRTGSSGRVCCQCLSLPCSYATRLLRAFAQPNLTQEGLSIGLCPNPCANSRAHRVIVRWARGIRQGVARGEGLTAEPQALLSPIRYREIVPATVIMKQILRTRWDFE